MSTMTTTTLNQLDTTIFKVIENELLTLIDKVVNLLNKSNDKNSEEGVFGCFF